MIRNAINLAELSGLPTEAVSARVRQLIQNRRPLNGELLKIDATIRDYETRYEMSSTVMLQRMQQSKLEDTADICRWQMLVEMRDRVARPS